MYRYQIVLVFLIFSPLLCGEILPPTHNLEKINLNVRSSSVYYQEEKTLDQLMGRVSEVELFKSFIKVYQKSYTFESDEGQKRFETFKEAIRKIEELNKSHTGRAKFGITQFIDFFPLKKKNEKGEFEYVPENDFEENKKDDYYDFDKFADDFDYEGVKNMKDIDSNLWNQNDSKKKFVDFDLMADEENQGIKFNSNNKDNNKSGSEKIFNLKKFENSFLGEVDDEFNRDEKLLQNNLRMKNFRNNLGYRILKFFNFDDFEDEQEKAQNISNKNIKQGGYFRNRNQLIEDVNTNSNLNKIIFGEEPKAEIIIREERDDHDLKRFFKSRMDIGESREPDGIITYREKDENNISHQINTNGIIISEEQKGTIVYRDRNENPTIKNKNAFIISEEPKGIIEFREENKKYNNTNKIDKNDISLENESERDDEKDLNNFRQSSTAFTPYDHRNYIPFPSPRQMKAWNWPIVFATADLLSANNFIKTKKYTSLSVQQITDCQSSTDIDIIGPYLHDTGLIAESQYPYVGSRGTCQDKKAKPVYYLDNIVENSIPPGFPNSMIVYPNSGLHLYKYLLSSPVLTSITMSDKMWLSYKGGIVTPDQTCNNCVWNVCYRMADVLVVGYGIDPVSKLEYWVIRGFLGKSWGENGYMRVVRNDSQSNWGLSCSMRILN